MLSQIELDYILSLINTYCKLGYDYYLCNTITQSNNNYDIDFYVSKEEIKAVSSTTFDLTNSIHIKIDSSNRNDNNYNQSLHSRDVLVDDNLTKIITVDEAEFIYTNAVITSKNITLVNPDLMLNSSNSYSNHILLGASVLLTGMIFLYIFFESILRLNR